jgi:hypothetical protein
MNLIQTCFESANSSNSNMNIKVVIIIMKVSIYFYEIKKLDVHFELGKLHIQII